MSSPSKKVAKSDGVTLRSSLLRKSVQWIGVTVVLQAMSNARRTAQLKRVVSVRQRSRIRVCAKSGNMDRNKHCTHILSRDVRLYGCRRAAAKDFRVRSLISWTNITAATTAIPFTGLFTDALCDSRSSHGLVHTVQYGRI